MTPSRINAVAKAVAALTGVSPLKLLDLVTVALIVDEANAQTGWDEAESEETRRLFMEALERIESKKKPLLRAA